MSENADSNTDPAPPDIAFPTYEIWVKPAKTPFAEKGDPYQNRYAWNDSKDVAILIADAVHEEYPDVDAVVREIQGPGGPYAVVYDTSKVGV